MSNHRALRDWSIAIALAALFALTGLGTHPLMASDETRVAGIGWEMQHTGQWWVPHLSGEPFLEHPPLHYALLGTSISWFGASPGAARLPGAIAALLTALLVFSLARRIADRSAGVPALLALIGIAGFARYSHRAVVDPTLALFVMCGYYAYVRAVWSASGEAPPRDGGSRTAPGWLFAVYVAAALAFWVKGLIGIVAVGGPVAIDALLARRWRVVLSPVHLAGVPLLVAACAAWPIVLEYAGGGEAARTFLINNEWYRIAPGTSAGHYLGGHVAPFWYYLPLLFGQFGWILLLVPATAAWLWRGDAPGWRVPALRFLAWVFPIGLVLLSIPGTKRGLYLLPFEPPLAVAVGAWIAATAGRADAYRSRVESAVNALCARVARVDAASAAAGPCRAPFRVAALAFAITVAWNAIGTHFVGRDRDLGPMVHAVAERIGNEPLLVLGPEESLLGAIPFYMGRIPVHSHTTERLAQQIAESRARFLLAPLFLREQITAELGEGAALQETWKAADDDFGLYAIRAEVAASGSGASASGLIQN
jgi:4-amino-4-deoxy-L-arabinose transferase-like glycosyltransferase